MQMTDSESAPPTSLFPLPLPLPLPLPCNNNNKRKRRGIMRKCNPSTSTTPSKKAAKQVTSCINASSRAPLVNSKETQTTIVVVPDIEDFKGEEASSISRCLLDWYYASQRVLPWRSNQKEGEGEEEEEEEEEEAQREHRAYTVWVSEVMLQQTRVAAVVDYYTRWMDRWPTLRHLSKASQEEVNQMWAGLGYYRRARYLLEGAKEIIENQGGAFPRTLENLRKVPGIGDYTAGAIASIAFKQAVPVVDGNVIRVLCRLKTISVNPKLPATIKRLWELAGQLVDAKRPGDLNQAIMELGATICRPTNPVCSSCPVAQHCNALANVRRYDSKNEQQSLSISTIDVVRVPSVTDYPMKVLKAIARKEFAAVCVVEKCPEYVSKNIHGISSDKNSFLLVKRPQKGLLAGLWEFPAVLVSGPNLSLFEQKAALDHYLESSLGIDIGPGKSEVILRKSVGQYVHVFSHIRLHMYIEWMLIYMPDGLGGPREIDDSNASVLKWVDKKSIQSMGLTSGVRKVYMMFEEFKNGTGKSMKRRQK